MFMTAEYRRGLIRVTLAASPRRGRVLAAKAVVIGAVTFVAGLAGAAAAVPPGERLLRANGNYILPVSALTELRVVAGTAALLAVAAVLALALGACCAAAPAAVTAVIAVIVLPYLLATHGPARRGRGLAAAGHPGGRLRHPADHPAVPAGDRQPTPRYGYFPLAPWAGFAVLCGYAALALGLAVILLRRRDA